MQERNFEKQVRGKMDELSFVPSAPVWGKVEEQIKKKREKKRFIFWLLPLLLTSGLGWWLLSGKDILPKMENATSTYKSEENNQVSGSMKPSSEPAPGDNEPNITNQPTLLNEYNSSLKTIVKQPVRTTRPGTIINQPERSENTYQELLIASNTKVPERVALPAPETNIYVFDPGNTTISKSLNIKPVPNINVDSIQYSDPATENKWQFAIALEGGFSGISKGFGSFMKSAEALDYAPPTPSTGGGFGSALPPPPSAPEASFAYSAGIDVKRKISHRFAVTSGLRYAYYSNTLRVGSAVYRDTALLRQDASSFRTNAYYRNNANTHIYTNKFHYIQIPLGIDYQLSKSSPLNMQAGIKLEKLISSNALFYNYNAGIYVKDKEMIEKTGVHLFTGISYQFRSNKTFSFAVGPHLQYSISNFSKNIGSQQHHYFVGLSTQFFLKK